MCGNVNVHTSRIHHPPYIMQDKETLKAFLSINRMNLMFSVQD